MMSKPKMVLIEARLLRQMVSLIKRQQACLQKWVKYAEKNTKPRKRRVRRNDQPMNAGSGTYGIQMGN
jgi:hypothetical protein